MSYYPCKGTLWRSFFQLDFCGEIAENESFVRRWFSDKTLKFTLSKRSLNLSSCAVSCFKLMLNCCTGTLQNSLISFALLSMVETRTFQWSREETVVFDWRLVDWHYSCVRRNCGLLFKITWLALFLCENIVLHNVAFCGWNFGITWRVLCLRRRRLLPEQFHLVKSIDCHFPNSSE